MDSAKGDVLPVEEPTQQTPLITNEQKVNDIFFTVLYFLCLAGFVAICVYYSVAYINNPLAYNQQKSVDIKALAIACTGCIGLVLASSILFLWLMLKYPKELIHASMAFIIVSLLFSLVLNIVYAKVNGAVTSGLFLLLSIGYMFAIRRSIPFTVALVKSTRNVLAKRRGIFAVILLGAAFSFLYSSATGWCLNILIRSTRHANATNVLLYVFLTFFSYWTLNLVLSMCHTIISGVFASYYLVDKLSTQSSSPVSDSTRRTLWYSFGSVALGSLLVAVVQTIRLLLNSARRRSEERERGFAHIFTVIIGAFADCLLSILEQVIRIFNYYAYIMISITGKSFVSSAKYALELFKEKGMSVIINDNIVGQVVFFGIVATNALAQLVIVPCFGVLIQTRIFVIEYFAITTVVGGLMSSFFLSTVQSGACTALVCYSIDPNCLARNENTAKAKAAIDQKLGLGYA